MRIWPWHRHSTGAPSDDLIEARKARADAEEQARRVRAQWPEVHRVGEQLREHLAENHFSAMVRDALRGER